MKPISHEVTTVVLCKRGLSDSYEIATVERHTKSSVFVQGKRYNRSDGELHGETRSRGRAGIGQRFDTIFEIRDDNRDYLLRQVQSTRLESAFDRLERVRRKRDLVKQFSYENYLHLRNQLDAVETCLDRIERAFAEEAERVKVKR